MRVRIYQTGFASIFVLITISIISLCFISSFYNAMRLQDIVKMRESYAERVYIAEGVLNYAIAFAALHYDAIKAYAKTSSQKIVICFDDLIPESQQKTIVRKKITLTFGYVKPAAPRHVPLVGKATIMMKEGIMVIDAVVSRGTMTLITLTSQIVRRPNSSDLVVVGWRHDQVIN